MLGRTASENPVATSARRTSQKLNSFQWVYNPRGSGYDLSGSQTKIQCSGVLFDLDGVLVDSTPAVERVWSEWAIEHGLDAQETVRRAHGRPSISTVRELLPNADPEKENLEAGRREIADVDGVVPLPGVMGLLGNLPQHADDCDLHTSIGAKFASARRGCRSRILTSTSQDVKTESQRPEIHT